MSVPAWAVFSLPLCIGIAVGSWFAYKTDIVFLDKRWTSSDLARLSMWNTLSSTVPLIVFSLGAELIRRRSTIGVLWVMIAAAIAFFSRLKLRSAEGIKPRQVKSGELYKHATAMARRVGVRLDLVSVVPFGRGRLTNAFGGWRGIAVTDDYGHWLHGGELDFVVGHELAHVQQKHGLKKLGLASALYFLTALFGLAVPAISGAWLLIHHFVVVLLPVLGSYWVSRRFEFSADQLGVKFTGGDAAIAISALASLYNHTGTPSSCSFIEGLFQTHPCLWRRIAAITKVWPVTPTCLERVRKQLETANQPAT